MYRDTEGRSYDNFLSIWAALELAVSSWEFGSSDSLQVVASGMEKFEIPLYKRS